jgi:hypothetical protein
VPVARLAAAHANLNTTLTRGRTTEARARRAEADASERLRQVRRTAAVPLEPGADALAQAAAREHGQPVR